MRIYGWAVNHSGCGQYRIGIPMWALGRAGHDATAFSVLNTGIPADLDVFVGQLVCTPDRNSVWEQLAALPHPRPALVYELDDDIWNLHSTNHGAARLTEPTVRAAVEQNLALADAVTVTTVPLAEIVSRFNPNVHVLPNCVDEALLRHERPRNERVTIGWAGGSSHGIDFAAAQAELKAFLRKNPGVDTHFVGANFGATVGRPQTRHTGWTTNLVEYMHGIDFDIGIAPLAYHAFNRSKSDLKVLEYAALGIPVVATDYGPYSDSVQHGVTGFLVKRPHEWARYLRDLVNDDALRQEMGDNARRWAATRTIQGNIWRWETAYRSAMSSAATATAAASGREERIYAP